MDTMPDFDQLHARFVDHIQWRYELIRPVVLSATCTTAQRAAETQTHPETVRHLTRRFRHQGMLGLLPAHTEITSPNRGKPVPEAVVEELARLKTLYDGFGYRELARIILHTVHERIDDKTVKRLWPHLSPPRQGELPFGGSHRHADRSQARLQVVKLYSQGWNKRSISHFLQVSRPTVAVWIRRFEAEHFAGLADKSRAPHTTPRKVWLPLMIAIYHLQKRHPDAGEFRLWSLLANDDIAVRTVGRVMALNKHVYDDIPHVRGKQPKKPPGLHPYKATRSHEYWFIDGRMMDFAFDGVKWWSIIMLDGYSRTMLAGAIVPTEASWAALMVLYTACRRYGAPHALISDSGGAYISNAFEAVCARLAIDHKTIISTQGESYMNVLETHFNIQRRLYDYQFSLTNSPTELEQVQQVFLRIYNTTAHQGLRKAGFDPPIPLEVLATAKGRTYSQDALARKFSHALFPRTTNRYGCVTLHRSHFYVEEGLPQTPVLLWVDGEQLRAMCDNVVLAEYHCRYDWRDRHVRDIRDGVFYTTQFASPQGSLLPFNPQESLVLSRPKPLMRQARLPFPAHQLWLFELVQTA